MPVETRWHHEGAARPSHAGRLAHTRLGGPRGGKAFAMQRELDVEHTHHRIEMAWRVVAHDRPRHARRKRRAVGAQLGQHQRAIRLGGQHELDVVIERSAVEIVQIFTGKAHAHQVRAEPVDLLHLHTAHLQGMAQALNGQGMRGVVWGHGGMGPRGPGVQSIHWLIDTTILD